jgi:hypothetical protein
MIGDFSASSFEYSAIANNASFVSLGYRGRTAEYSCREANTGVTFALCQQWLSILGLTLDITGFLLIAFEWRHMFWREYDRRQGELQHDWERSSAENRGEVYHDPRAADYTMAKLFSKLLSKEGLFRRNLLYAGVVLVLLAQVLGSWPHGISVIGAKSC